MLSPDMTFPQTFDTVNSTSQAVITGTVGNDIYRRFVGYTQRKPSHYSSLEVAGMWDRNGNCLAVGITSGDDVYNRQQRSLKPNKSEAQKLYEQLDADGKALARLVGNTNMTLLATYLKDKVGGKVDVNLAAQVWNEGQAVGWV